MMMSCWHQDPNKRPTFSRIVELWDTDLEDLAGYMNMDCLFPEMKKVKGVKEKVKKRRSNSLATDTTLHPPTTERRLGVSLNVASPNQFK